LIGERPDNKVIDHIDRNKLDNNVSNLRYITQKENCFNHDKVKVEIPANTENRQTLVCKLYRDNNQERVKQNKKNYYEMNKTIIAEKAKHNTIEVECDECHQFRTIRKCTYNRNKRLGVNTCRCCSSVKNLQKVNL